MGDALAVARAAVDQAHAAMVEAKKLCVNCGGPDDVPAAGERFGAVHAPHAAEVEAAHAALQQATAAQFLVEGS